MLQAAFMKCLLINNPTRRNVFQRIPELLHTYHHIRGVIGCDGSQEPSKFQILYSFLQNQTYSIGSMCCGKPVKRQSSRRKIPVAVNPMSVDYHVPLLVRKYAGNCSQQYSCSSFIQYLSYNTALATVHIQYSLLPHCPARHLQKQIPMRFKQMKLDVLTMVRGFSVITVRCTRYFSSRTSR